MVTLRPRREDFVHNAPVKTTTAAFCSLAILLVAAAVRLPNLTAGYPYVNYVDEGNFLYPVSEMLRQHRWEPGWYLYPSLPLIATATAARLADPVRRTLRGGRSLADDLRSNNGMYDDLSPDLLIAGRVTSLLAGLGIVVLAGRLARRLAGPRAGLAAALLTAVAPPLVIRGAIASVDPFAAFFVLAVLLFAERLRTAVGERPGREAFAAGAMAGFAFAAKYPALLAGLVPLWIVLRSAPPEREKRRAKLRLLVLVAAGAASAAVVAMPGLLLHPRDAWAAILRQGVLYAGLTSPAPLWRQALVRAEWDLPYDHPELGAAFLLLALAGLVFAWRDRELSPAVQAWSLYAAAALLLVLRYPFHPFRNLLPLVAPACILVAILWDRLRARLAGPLQAAAVDAGAVILLAFFFVRPIAGYAWKRLHLRDSRAEAVEWLAPRLRPGDAVLVIRELAILPEELDRLPVRTFLAHWPRVTRAIANRHHRFLVASVPPPSGPYRLDPDSRAALLRDYEVRVQLGTDPTPQDDYWWHGNRQIVFVLERRAGPE